MLETQLIVSSSFERELVTKTCNQSKYRICMFGGVAESPLFAGIQQLLESLEQLTPNLPERKDDLQFVRNMLHTNEFHSLVTVSI